MLAKLRYALIGLSIGAVLVALLRPRAPLVRIVGEGPMEAELALGRPVAEVCLVKMPMDQAVAELSRLSGATIHIDEKSLNASGINLKTPVTVRGRNMPLSQLLDQAMDNASTPTIKLGAIALRDRIWISTGEALSQNPSIVRCYEVSDVIDAMLAPRPLGKMPVVIWRQDGAIQSPPLEPYRQAAEDLMRTITDVVAPDSWREAGGMVGSIRYIAGRLVVVQSAVNHRALQSLLHQIREKPDLPSSPGPAPQVYKWHEGLGEWVSRDSDPAEKALATLIAPIKLDGVTFERAVGMLRQRSAVSLFIDRDALKKGGFPLDAPVTLDLHDVTLARALEVLLFAVPPSTRPGFAPDGGIITITTKEVADSLTITRLYETRDWLIQRPGDSEQTVEQALEDLAKAIVDAVDPDSWRENGGAAGSIRGVGGQLIITQSWENQQKVGQILNAFRVSAKRTAATTLPTQPTVPR